MKVSEILSEGSLRGTWTIQDIRDMKPAKLKALTINATKANDQKVLDLISTVAQERFEIQKAAAEKAKKATTGRKRNADPVKALSDADLDKISVKITMVVGDTFPDGDPIDTLGKYVEKTYSVEPWDVTKVLDKAVKKLGKFKGYYDYLASMWDQYTEDNPGLGRGMKNPWK